MPVQRLDLNVGTGQKALDRLARQGLVVRKTTSLDIPVFPSDLSELADEELMTLFTQITAYANFLAAQLACAFIDERSAERDLDIEENFALLHAHNGKVTKDTMTVLKAQVATSAKVRELRDVLEAKYNYRKLVEMMSNNSDRDLTLVSRELTRRTSGSDTAIRRNKVMP